MRFLFHSLDSQRVVGVGGPSDPAESFAFQRRFLPVATIISFPCILIHVVLASRDVNYAACENAG